MSSKLAKKLQLRQAVLLIVLSVCLISVPAWSVWLIYRKFFDIRATDPKYNIVAIVQTGPEREGLKTNYLAELLDLSVDRPKNIYQINLKEEQEKLKSFPIIQNAILKRIPPATLYIDYTVRQPISYISDLTNTAIDMEGVLFPFNPFFSPKRLPEIHLGLPQRLSWGDRVEDERLKIAFDILNLFETHLKNKNLGIVRIDVADAIVESLGKKQIVVVLNDDGKQILLRMPCEDYERKFNAFQQVYAKNLKKKSFSKIVIDLRLPDLAFIVDASP